MEFFWKLFEAIVIACLLLHMFRHLGDLLTIKILKGRIKNLYCQNRDILGFCENYLKLLHALYNCVANIKDHAGWTEKWFTQLTPGGMSEVTTHVMLPARTRAGILATVKQLDDYFVRLPMESDTEWLRKQFWTLLIWCLICNTFVFMIWMIFTFFGIPTAKTETHRPRPSMPRFELGYLGRGDSRSDRVAMLEDDIIFAVPCCATWDL